MTQFASRAEKRLVSNNERSCRETLSITNLKAKICTFVLLQYFSSHQNRVNDIWFTGFILEKNPAGSSFCRLKKNRGIYTCIYIVGQKTIGRFECYLDWSQSGKKADKKWQQNGSGCLKPKTWLKVATIKIGDGSIGRCYTKTLKSLIILFLFLQ